METDKVTIAAMESIRPGGRTKVFCAKDINDYLSQSRMAYHVKQKRPRADGGIYIINCVPKAMTISVKVEKGGKK